MEKSEFDTAIERLQALPEEAKADIAPQLNQYLNKLDDLNRLGYTVPVETCHKRVSTGLVQ